MKIQNTSSAAEAQKLLRPLRQDLLRLVRHLVRTNTVAVPPHGNETPAQHILYDFLKAHAVRPELYDTAFVARSKHRLARKDRKYAGRKNLIARLSGSGRGQSLLLNGHMDTVPAARVPWRDAPWSGAWKNGRVYGLGSFDMKGGLCAQAAVLCAVRASGSRLAGDLLFESVVDEEWGGGGGTLAARLRGDSADACVISEGTQLQIFRATRGGFVVDLLLEAGDSATYFSNNEVVSPTRHLSRLLDWIESWRLRRAALRASGAYGAFPDPAPVQILAIEANRFDPDVPLSVPLKAGVRVYLQFLPSEDVPAVIQSVRDSLTSFQAGDPFFRTNPIAWRPLFDPSLLGHELAEDHPWTRRMAEAATTVTGRPVVITAAPYPCDAFLMHREFGIPTLLFGPTGAGAHNADEYVDFASIMTTAEVLLSAALEWCGG
jgi:acetylornithine deacetylase